MDKSTRIWILPIFSCPHSTLFHRGPKSGGPRTLLIQMRFIQGQRRKFSRPPWAEMSFSHNASSFEMHLPRTAFDWTAILARHRTGWNSWQNSQYGYLHLKSSILVHVYIHLDSNLRKDTITHYVCQCLSILVRFCISQASKFLRSNRRRFDIFIFKVDTQRCSGIRAVPKDICKSCDPKRNCCIASKRSTK